MQISEDGVGKVHLTDPPPRISDWGHSRKAGTGLVESGPEQAVQEIPE